jgi:hypothetical protein
MVVAFGIFDLHYRRVDFAEAKGNALKRDWRLGPGG